MDFQKREKKEFLEAKARMLQQLKEDKERMFGKKEGASGDATVQPPKPTGP